VRNHAGVISNPADLRRRTRAVSWTTSSSTIRIFFPAIATRCLYPLESLFCAKEADEVFRSVLSTCLSDGYYQTESEAGKGVEQESNHAKLECGIFAGVANTNTGGGIVQSGA
jgi:hypothetical protein